MDEVLVESRGDVLLITLNRPAVLNAVDGALTAQLGDSLARLEADPLLRVGVITGTGTAFCAGLDIKAVAAGAPIEATRHPEWGFGGATSHRLSKPLVAAVNGDAVGGGFEIALSCDLIVAVPTARLGLPEVRRGLFAAGGGVLRLAQQLPTRVAMEFLLTGRLFTAEEAASWGLVNRILPADELQEGALRLAGEVADNAPLAVQATKRIALAVQAQPTDASLRTMMDAEAARVFRSEDAREGIASFMDRRSPVFTGR